MQALTDSAAFWILLFAVLIVVYLLPTLIGLTRGVDALALVFLVNLIGGADPDRLARRADPRLRTAATSPRAGAATMLGRHVRAG